MTATDELRRLLDERGVEYDTDDEDGCEFTEWVANGLEWEADSRGELVSLMPVMLITPEQAIAATLGAETIEKAAKRIEVLSGLAREYLHHYGMLMRMAGEDVTDEVLAIESVINEVCGRRVVDE